ncbi:MAG TPA: sulfurtransferase TusA family protein [Rhizomicrobium sp.]|jgi:tRNA 2-thiouridine synthesizing protein A|nr:sulfurtransferase TusA family protein [Rhizomicrobium sp.]
MAQTESEILDLRGLKCPLPALLARRTVERAPGGTPVTVLTDDPMAPIDVPHMCRQEGFEIVSLQERGSVIEFILRRPG